MRSDRQSPGSAHARSPLAQAMYDERGGDGKRRYTVAEIAAEFGVTRPTIYRHLSRPATATG